MSSENPTSTAPKVEPSGKTVFPLILSVLFLAVLGLSVFAERSYKPAEAAPATAAAAPAATPATAPPAPATIDDVKSVKSELDALAKKIEAMPKPEMVDLKPVQEKIDGLAAKTAEAAEAAKKADDLAAKLAASEKTVADLKGELDGLKTEIVALKEAMKAKPAVVESKPVVDDAKPKPAMDVAAWTAATDLFKAGKYADALAVFKKLPADDARVLYYSALSVGLSTQKWDGEAMDLVKAGQKAEKAGTPSKAEIDATFANLADPNTKKWLDYYRSLVK